MDRLILMSIVETLYKLRKKQPSYIYLDETDNKIKEKPLDSAAAVIDNKKVNEAKLIHQFMFGH